MISPRLLSRPLLYKAARHRRSAFMLWLLSRRKINVLDDHGLRRRAARAVARRIFYDISSSVQYLLTLLLARRAWPPSLRQPLAKMTAFRRYVRGAVSTIQSNIS